jgi:hypothetical protein
MQARLDRTVMRREKILAPVAALSGKAANLVPALMGPTVLVRFHE